MQHLRVSRASELNKVAEVLDRSQFLSKTFQKTWSTDSLRSFETRLATSKLSVDTVKSCINGGLLTYMLHCEARIASFLGKGFYTIGPCGEELLGFVQPNLESQDLTALHYRHLSTSLMRQVNEGKSFSSIALDRARGFACSTLDPVTGGRHCSIGGNPQREFLVTSTLSSQVPSAVGRALAIPLSNRLLGNQSKFAPNAISYVSVGDGSINNAHFLSALNLAQYSQHNNIKCPMVLAITDNKICISLRSTGYVDRFVDSLRGSMHVQVANGQDFLDIYEKSQLAIQFARSRSRPAVLLINNLPRRFGHAATDRQFAYFSAQEIEKQLGQDPLSDALSMLVSLGLYEQTEVEALFHGFQGEVERAFNQATEEAKITSRERLVESNSAPLVSVPPLATNNLTIITDKKSSNANNRPEVMRKQMTRVFDELLGQNANVVYIGEDVQHGGYYLVTDELYKKYPLRVRDFPPDETSLIGAGMGFAQSGLVPIVEIPYAKYLDCAFDMFNEAAIMHWLSQGQQPNGMIIRLQGFDKGIFGGNFHTHNMLYFPPGLDVICCSNGYDYVRAMRFAYQQAKAGRLIMFVDSTDLLNRRHLEERDKDEFFLTSYPDSLEKTLSTQSAHKPYSFEEVTVYTLPGVDLEKSHKQQIVIISAGNGLATSLLARKQLQSQAKYADYDIVVIDSPCLSQTPQELVQYFTQHKEKIGAVVFADICKYGPGMSMTVRLSDLQSRNLLHNNKWRVIGASPTYNPLGTYLTFLSTNDVVEAVEQLV